MMIRYREDPATSIAMASAVILLAGTLAFMLLAPRPEGPTKAERIEAENKLRLEIRESEKRRAQATAFNQTNTWVGSPDAIAPAVLAKVTQVARARGVRLISLRPQTVNTKTEPPMLPFLAVVEGPYTAAMQFARDMETPGNRLAVSLVQVTSADAASDKVTASVGMAAFMQPQTTSSTSSDTKETKRA
jgi:hypothetical protein